MTGLVPANCRAELSAPANAEPKEEPMSPTPKIQAAAIAAAVVTVLTFVLVSAGVHVTAEVGTALTVLIATFTPVVAGYVKR